MCSKPKQSSLKKSLWTEEEDKVVIDTYKKFGSKWATHVKTLVPER
jgi:hypothetical protein